MSATQTIDYAALAKQAGAISSQPAPSASPASQSGSIDYAALAKQAGAVSSTPPPAADTGVWAGVKRNTVGMIAGLYHALTDPATDQEKQDLLTKVQAANAQGDNVPETVATDPSQATLAYHRLIDAPADVLNKKGQDEQAAAQDLLSKGQTWKGANLSLSGATDRMLSNVPMAGPWLNSVARRWESGDKSGAATDIAAAVIAENAPEITNAVGDALSGPRQSLAESIAGPVVRKPVGATLEDARFNRNPAAAIPNEGLMGSKEQMVQQATQRIAQISADTDATLQAHPNANAQIDAEPIIDGAIAEATKAAKKVGNKAAITRLNDLGDALKTEYGPIQGTPFEINNLKRDIGEAAETLGAFKSTDPLESSAASAMADVYGRLKDAVNQQVPEIAANNERVANLLSARMGLKRNIALETNKGLFSGLSLTNLPFKFLEKTAGSAPARSAAANLIAPGVPQGAAAGMPFTLGAALAGSTAEGQQ